MSRRRQLFGDNTPSDGDVGGTSSDQGNEFSEGVENHQNRDSGVLIPKIGMEFQTENDAYEFYLAYAEKVGFSVRKHKSYTDKDKNLLSRKFCCSAEGERPDDERDLYVKKHRAETRFDCEAMMRIYRKNGKFELTEFVEEHNHYLASPNKVHLLRSHRKISPAAAMQIEMAHKVGIAPKASHDLLVEQFGGRENHGNKKKGDIVDDDDTMTNIFWPDAKMRNDYSNYGDVVCFDTTYRKNGEGRPLAIFVGVNNVAAQMYTQPTMFHSNLGEQRPLAFGRFMEQTQSSMIHSNHGAQSPLAFGRGVQQSLPQVLGVSSSLGFSRFRTQSPIGFATPYGISGMAICNEQCGCSLPCVGGMSCFCYREK
ncbi:hypothetical protein OROMI_033630 [Orobanche minor]